MTDFQTADLCDAHPHVAVVEPGFRNFGGRSRFRGPIATIKAFEDNSLVRAALSEPGQGRVLVVDGGGSRRCAMLGDRMAALAIENGWAGVVINGCLRDSALLGTMALGIRALDTHPRRSEKRNEGQRDIPVHFGGVTFQPGAYLYADEDGIILAPEELKA